LVRPIIAGQLILHLEASRNPAQHTENSPRCFERIWMPCAAIAAPAPLLVDLAEVGA
jgi:hypothetical protein